MADSKSTHQIEISAVDKATQVINGIDNRFKSLGKTIDKALAVVGVAGVAALTGALSKAVKEAAAEEQIMKRLQTAIEATGKSYASVSGQVNTLLKSQQNLTQFADDESASALATLIQLTQNYDLSMKALVVTQDLAASGLFDLDSASTAVGKALTGNVMLLQRMGIKLKEGDDVLAALSARFGGTASKNVDTFSGRLKQLQNVISDAFEALGGPMLEPLKKAIETLRNTIASPEIQKRISEFAKSIADMIPKAVDKLSQFSTWVVTNGDTILTFFKALIAIRVTSWAIESASAIANLVTKLAAIPAWMFAGGAVAFGTFAIGSQTADAMTATIKAETDLNKIVQATGTSYQTLRRVQEEVFGKFSDYRSGTDAQRDAWDAYVKTLYLKVIPAVDVLSGSYNALTEQIRNAFEEISRLDNKVLGSRLGRGVIDPLIRNERGLLFPEDDRNPSRRGPRQNFNLPTISAEEFFGPSTDNVSALQEQIQSIAPAFQFAMSSVTNAIVQGAITGALKIKDVFNALRNAIMQILADLAARAATAGLLSLLFPSIGFSGAFRGLSTGNFTGGVNSVRPAPVGANPNLGVSGFGGGVTVIFQGDVYGSADSIASHIEDKLAYRMRMGTSKILRGN